MGEEIERHILWKYEIQNKLGKGTSHILINSHTLTHSHTHTQHTGAYGIVWKAIEKKSRSDVALKKCFDCFRNATDAQRTYREVMYLTELGDHTNIVKLMGIMSSENGRDLYLVFNYMETDLHAVVRANILEEVHKQYIVYQLLKALKYIHSADLIHRDIKPSNLLLNSDCHLRVCDFGLCRSIKEDENSANNPVRGVRALFSYLLTQRTHLVSHNKSHPCHSLVSLTRNNTTRIIRSQTRTPTLEHRYSQITLLRDGIEHPRFCSDPRITPEVWTCGRSVASLERCYLESPCFLVCTQYPHTLLTLTHTH